MSEQLYVIPLLVFLFGTVVVCSIFVRFILKQLRVPPLIGYLAIGFLLRIADGQLGFLNEEINLSFAFMASVGIIVLLFRVGLESDLTALLSQISHATVIWVGNVFLSGALGFVTTFYLLGLGLIPSIFVAAALTATSVGISASIWHEAKAIKSPTGSLLVDVAEMDDISGVIIMAFLFAITPVLQRGTDLNLLSILAKTSGVFFLKAIGFGIICLVFSRYVEQHITTFFKDIKHSPDPLIVIIGIGFIIASIAGWLGFSVAIGALFAGLIFSRDPEAVKLDLSFESLYALFTPFFFINIGLQLDPDAFISGAQIGSIILIVAILGKFIGTAGPALLATNLKNSIVLGVSMIPRAEIAMIIIQQGHALGGRVVPSEVYSGMVLVSAVTCLISPLILHRLLKFWPQKQIS